MARPHRAAGAGQCDWEPRAAEVGGGERGEREVAARKVGGGEGVGVRTTLVCAPNTRLTRYLARVIPGDLAQRARDLLVQFRVTL